MVNKWSVLFFGVLLFSSSLLNAAVFLEDNRTEIMQSNQSQLKQSILAMIPSKKIVEHEIDSNLMKINYESSNDYFGRPFCSDLKFLNQPNVAVCTGFYIGNDLLVTAGHCALDGTETIKDEVTKKCQASSWVLNYEMNSIASNTAIDVKKSEVFACEKVVAGAFLGNLDFAVIKLKGDTGQLRPLTLNPNQELKSKLPISMAGYPSGLPLKYADHASIYYSSSSADYFKSDLDSFAGNSGSPVFNDAMEVIGVVVAGEVDYAVDKERQCTKVNVCNGVGRLCDVYTTQYGSFGTVVTKIKSVLAHMKN